MSPFIPVAVAFAMVVTTAASAQNGERSPIAGLQSCRAIQNDGERLRCFDREAAAFGASVDSKKVVVMDQQAVRQAKRSLFGFSMPRIKLFGDGDDTEEAKEITTTLRTVRGLGYGKYSFTVDDGAVWQTTEASRSLPKAGEKVIIKRAALGSYFIKVGKMPAIKGMRVG
jgi:hypothetical protein